MPGSRARPLSTRSGTRTGPARRGPASTGLGHRQVQRWNLPEGWVISRHPAHAALVSEADFIAAQDAAAPRGPAGPAVRRYLLAGLLAVRDRRPVLAAFFLAYGALTRETVMVAVAAIAGLRVIGMLRGRTRPGRDDLAWLIPTAAFAAWEVVVKLAIGSVPLLADGGRNAGAPFIAPLQAFRHNLGHIHLHEFEQYDLWFLELAVLVAFSVAALPRLRSTSAPLHERLAFVLYLVEICVVTPSTWNSLDADMRSFIEAYLLAVVILLGAPRRPRVAWQLSSMTALMTPALIVIVQRRFTGS